LWSGWSRSYAFQRVALAACGRRELAINAIKQLIAEDDARKAELKRRIGFHREENTLSVGKLDFP
jgi:hypothetical protein